MATLNRNNSNWSFEERRKINENWDILEGLANSTASGNNGLKQEVDQLKITVGQNTDRVTNSIQLSNQANFKADNAISTANQANSTANSALSTANGINSKVDNAISTANQANEKSDNAVLTANGINSKVDNAVSTAYQANLKADNAVLTANQANEKSDYVQSQLDSVIADGDSSAEVVQARNGKTTLRERLDDEYDEVTSQLDQIKPRPYEYVDFGIAFDSSLPTLPVHDNHASWAHANVAYDDYDDVILVFYDVKPSHVLSDNRVLMRKKFTNGGFSAPFVVADKMAQGISCKTQGSGIAANGDYVSLVYEFSGANSGLNVYRSTDKGLNWTSERVLINNNPVTAFNGDVTGFLVLKSGRILTLIKNAVDYSRIMYSDDHGQTWQFSATELNGATEPAWVELPDGTIIAYLRANVDNEYYRKIPAKFTVSTNGGVNWTTPVDSTSILDYTNSNGHLIFHEDTKVIEFIHHSRFELQDGYSSLYVSVAKIDDIKNDRMGDQIRISRLSPSYKPVLGGLGDSGYVGAAKDKYGTIHAFYYNGTYTSAQICYLEGRKSPLNIYVRPFDQRTGKPIVEPAKQHISKVDFTSFFEQGGISGAIGTNDLLVIATNRLRGKRYLIVDSDTKYQFNVTTGYEFVLRLYDVNYTIIYDGGWRTDMTVTTTSDTAYLKILLRKVGDLDITPSDATMANVTQYKLKKEKLTLYSQGEERLFYVGALNQVLVNNATVTKDTNNLELVIPSTNANANAILIASEPVDITRFFKVKMAVEITGLTGDVNASVRLYNKPNPTFGDDGRLGLATISTNGKHIIEADISAARGSGYAAVAVTKTSGTEGYINAKIYEISYE